MEKNGFPVAFIDSEPIQKLFRFPETKLHRQPFIKYKGLEESLYIYIEREREREREREQIRGDQCPGHKDRERERDRERQRERAEMESSEGKCKILIFGGSGYLGKYMVKASIFLGHPTYVYSRPPTAKTSPSKIDLLHEFQAMGVSIIHGELEEHEKLVRLIKQVDVVISVLAYPQVFEQLKIIDAIKVADNVKRFLPSDFGCEEDRVNPLPPFQQFLEKKRKIRRATEEAGIPYTFVSANCFASYFVNYLLNPHEIRDNINVYGSGKANDIAMYTIKVANDPRTSNRIVTYRPPKNIISQLELISLWEKKIGRNFNRVHISEQEIIKLSETLPYPQNVQISILHAIFVKGDLMNFEVGEDILEASKLYPDLKYTSIDQLLDIFLVNPPKPVVAAF
ncbi:eugenol synthase 1 isoform X3 [Ziziphus jujuba]|uniref:Eugenol synthase 1 isoform X3 n=1 Tax=Ziziphus jujuba TaxID=326968 RepID=A0ABM3ILR1_ZIZJJ|nr:eugenol synthase 1 isoform X3 [Ziziphus jujuba]